MPRFYITTAIVYTNADPHIGFALELVQADAIARYRRMMGDDVRFCTGTDEHGSSVMRAAQKAGKPTNEFVDGIAARVRELAERLHVSNTDFVRTSDQVRHWPAAQKLWSKLADRGDLYKKKYEGAYCIGHEAFIKPSELVDGLCPLHKTKPEIVQEENWFFRLTRYTPAIRELISSDALNIVPASRKTELLNLLDDAEDVSFSRPSAQLPWGIPVPGDATQTMYVWVDALSNYLSALGYGTDGAGMDYWPAQVHLVGKDITRFHAIIWPAILLSAGLEVPKAIYIHGFITVDGQKMSKTLGNVINPFELLDSWNADVVRYFLLRELQSTEDSDFSWKNLKGRYISDLANGLGNLVQRTTTLAEATQGGTVNLATDGDELAAVLDDEAYHQAFRQFRLHDVAAHIWDKIGIANAFLNVTEPWKREGEERTRIMGTVLSMLSHIAWLLDPLMPTTAQQIAVQLGVARTRVPSGISKVHKAVPLFPREPRS
ncbi:MAG TPA: class I tRNA ligase family protein [Candidatus Paceibacterota bacterium]|nr:class I tRNA ligase family protein [Candidatus Paceibacterota bacterium]